MDLFKLLKTKLGVQQAGSLAPTATEADKGNYDSISIQGRKFVKENIRYFKDILSHYAWEKKLEIDNEMRMLLLLLENPSEFDLVEATTVTEDVRYTDITLRYVHLDPQFVIQFCLSIENPAVAGDVKPTDLAISFSNSPIIGHLKFIPSGYTSPAIKFWEDLYARHFKCTAQFLNKTAIQEQ